MKRPSQKAKHQQIRLAAARRRARRKKLVAMAAIRRVPVVAVAYASPPEVAAAQRLASRLPSIRVRRLRGRGRFVRLMAPSSLHFGVDHDGVADFAEKIRVLWHGDMPLYLDFTEVKEAGPAAALYIAAEVDRWQSIKQPDAKPVVYDFARWHPPMRRYFLDLGLFELLRVANLPHDPPSASRQHILKMRRNNMIEPNDVRALRDQLHRLCGAVPNRLGFFDALCEAMSNVTHHAYQDDDPSGWPRLTNYWWMTADFDPAASVLRIAFVDQGVGIPNRLPRSGLGEAVSGILAGLGVNDDASRIQAALQYGRSSTGQAGRGKGFHDMEMFVDGNPNNWMRVLSGRGECVYRSGKFIAERHARSVVGTLIEWSLAVPSIG